PPLLTSPLHHTRAFPPRHPAHRVPPSLPTRRSSDLRDELQARINFCNEANADILVSLHLNGYDDESARGYEVLYTGDREFGDKKDRKSTRLNSSHVSISYAVFCLKKENNSASTLVYM